MVEVVVENDQLSLKFIDVLPVKEEVIETKEQETVKEVKLVFETVSENMVTKKETTIKEHKGMASKATGTTARKPEVISEVSDAVRRMQKLAGII